MIKVDKHISELLYEHDCVIVPEFGGFVANYAPAKIHPVQHTFIPPSKNIVFNKNLRNNDGLLANHISYTEKTNYPDALKHIQLFTSTTNTQLKKGAKVTIEEVGTLFFDRERNIQFEPGTTNYLLESFGLSQFQSPAIKRDNIGKRFEKEFKDRGAIPAVKKKINIKSYVAIAIAIPLIFGMIWIPLKTDLLKNINYSSLNPIASKRTIIENTKYAAPVKTKLNSTSTTPQPVTANIVDNKIVEVVKADSTKVAVSNANTNPDLRFHLITGCFQILDNANKFVINLQNQNITASIIGKRNGLYFVSAGDYASRKEANTQLKQLKKNQPDAWLLKK